MFYVGLIQLYDTSSLLVVSEFANAHALPVPMLTQNIRSSFVVVSNIIHELLFHQQKNSEQHQA
jgi:hypothetical protein